MVVKLKILLNPNTENFKMKHFSNPYSKYFIINRPDLYNLQTRKIQLGKQLRIETDFSKYLTTK